MKKVFTVYHTKELHPLKFTKTFQPEFYEAVAEVTLDVQVEKRDSYNLELVYNLTQNIHGSWSWGEYFNWMGEPKINPDYSSNIKVLVKYPTFNDKEYGLRSTSVGDVIAVDGKYYFVDVVGFEELS